MKGPFRCPDCGSTNTGQSTYSDYCNDCGYSQGYRTAVKYLMLALLIIFASCQKELSRERKCGTVIRTALHWSYVSYGPNDVEAVPGVLIVNDKYCQP